MAELHITATENGPYRVDGPLTIVDEKGNPVEVEAGETIWLCRCGGSRNKPFCDSTHRKIGFEGG